MYHATGTLCEVFVHRSLLIVLILIVSGTYFAGEALRKLDFLRDGFELLLAGFEGPYAAFAGYSDPSSA